MFRKIFNQLFSSKNTRIINRMYKLVEIINKFEPSFKNLSDNQLKMKTKEFRIRLKKGETLDNLMPEAFATVRETSKRLFNMRHFDVQLLGGMILNSASVAEMRTGEGKTLTATLPAYLNALSEKGVHIVTVNDYLAKRDAESNRILFNFLDMTVGINLPNMSTKDKKKAYNADITYGTNNEYGFDYLRDNMIFNLQEKVQRHLYYALIDEVDSILIDEARTPLIISSSSEDGSQLYIEINKIVPLLIPQEKEDSNTFQGNGHFSVDAKTRQIYLTERGLIKIEEILVQKNLIQKEDSLYSSTNIILMHHVISALRAHFLFKKNIDYIVKYGEVIIVDEHTGRTMPGRRWSDGIHQAIEAKEHVKIKKENQTMASITFQNYFRLYEKLSGMTGTAITEANEFKTIYNLNTIVVPTNRPMIRKDLSDLVYITHEEKINAIIEDIRIRTSLGQPILVGTISIEKSELISHALKRIGIKHNILNAKFHAREAEIISQAGKPGTVTIATNMAGRGTDIVLGGNWQAEILNVSTSTEKQKNEIKKQWKKRHDFVIKVGGLHVIGTERHEARRIDNQLRGRSGRQGDPGSSRFYLSMEDTMMRIFSSERIAKLMLKLGMKKNEAIEHPWVAKAIENAQRKIENQNFEIRKQLLEYDNVANEQRRAIYFQRNSLLNMDNVCEVIYEIHDNVFKNIIKKYISLENLHEKKHFFDLENYLKEEFNLNIHIEDWLNTHKYFNLDALYAFVIEKSRCMLLKKEKKMDVTIIKAFKKRLMLETLDMLWKDHLVAMDYLRQGIHLRGYAQKDPKQEYKRESFIMFNFMLEALKYEVIKKLCNIEFLK